MASAEVALNVKLKKVVKGMRLEEKGGVLEEEKVELRGV